MNIEISKLSNGLTVVTDPMANLESAALGVWVGTGGRNEMPRRDGHLPHARAYGVQGHRQPQRAPDRRRDRSGGRLSQRLYQPRADRVSCPRAERRCGAGAGLHRRHPGQLRPSTPTSWNASARWCCRNWARRATRPTTSSSIICKASIYHGPADGLADPGRRSDRRRLHAARACATTAARAISRRRA